MEALWKEMELQRDYLGNERVESLYLGGGTPSLLSPAQLEETLQRIAILFHLADDAEITLEANPDDITHKLLAKWRHIGINRLSIGVQSFADSDLQWMNRAHNSATAIKSLENALEYFNNITADLIFGTPTLTDAQWEVNTRQLFSLGIPHLSCYALTVEPRTALEKMIEKKKKEAVDPEQQSRQFLQLMEWAAIAGYEHYEISNFAKPGFRSRHNSSYWKGISYLGLGPSAHSFNGRSRQWNIANNALYIQSIQNNTVPFEAETLSPVQILNEYIMTSLRTMEGIDRRILQLKWKDKEERLVRVFSKYIDAGKGIADNHYLRLTNEGKLYADGIAAELFFEETTPGYSPGI